jgi:hypothetical protein
MCCEKKAKVPLGLVEYVVDVLYFTAFFINAKRLL